MNFNFADRCGLSFGEFYVRSLEGMAGCGGCFEFVARGRVVDGRWCVGEMAFNVANWSDDEFVVDTDDVCGVGDRCGVEAYVLMADRLGVLCGVAVERIDDVMEVEDFQDGAFEVRFPVRLMAKWN